MKDQILKIAGVKSEKEFYKKYPTEEAFQKAHSKEFKKAKLGAAMVPKAQGGTTYSLGDEDNRPMGFMFNGRAMRLGDINKIKEKSIKDPKPISAWEDLSDINNYTSDRGEQKALKKEYEGIKDKYKGLTINQYVAAKRDADRTSVQLANNERYGKYFDESGRVLPNTDLRLIDPNLRFYKEKFPKQSKLSVEDVLGTWNGMEGGFSNYEGYVNEGYRKPLNKPMKEGGQLHKLQQLTDFGNPPIADMGMTMDGPIGSYMSGNGQEGIARNSFLDNYLYQQQQAQDAQAKAASASSQQPIEGLGDSLGKFIDMVGKGKAGTAKKGKSVPKYQVAPAPVAPSQPKPIYDPFGLTTMGGQTSQYNVYPPYAPDYKGPINKAAIDAFIPNTPKDSKFMDMIGGAQGIGNIVGTGIGMIQEFSNYRKQKKEAEKSLNVAKVVNQAAKLPQEQITRKYLRPEDRIIDPNQRFPTYGVGTNYLSRNGSIVRAEDGSMIGGNPTEIQNTYNPGDLYSDLGFEPLNDSNKVKQYEEGGYIPSAQDGYNGLNSFVQGLSGMLKSGPGVGGVLGLANFAIGDIHKRNLANLSDQTKSLNQSTAFMNAGQGLHGQYSQYMEDGGWVSHDWQPQVISQFDGHPIKSLLTKDPMMDTLRTGGHISQNTMYPQDQYALGGELKTTWGGYAEPMSHNPYMPGTGQTVMFRGKSHEEGDGNGHTGIGVKYGEGGHDSYTDYAEYGTKDADADVEVERGEPALEMTDPQTGEKNMVVYGNLMINKGAAKEIGDPKAAGKKYKNYVAGLAKIENKQNKIIEKATDQINNLNVYTSFDKLKMDALKSSITGANMKLKDIATKKTNASIVQNATNETASEHGIDADAFARGKIKVDKQAQKEMAKYGKEIFKAQKGLNALAKVPLGQKKGAWAYGNVTNDDVGKFVTDNSKWFDFANKIPGFDPRNKKHVLKFQKAFNEKAKELGSPAHLLEDGKFGEQTVSARPTDGIQKAPGGEEQYTGEIPLVDINLPDDVPTNKSGDDLTTTTTQETTKKKGFDWMNMANQILPYFRPSNQQPLDQSQLYPELYALASNKVEPVQAQLYHPELDTPYDISLQDQMNANQSDFNALQRQIGYNPEAAASLSAQKYAANSKVLGEQFRMNQGLKAGIYAKNRDVLNDAQMKNLGILDQQFVRQETAKSKTREVAQAALISMADKIAKNKLENRTLGIYENLYNYRFGKDGRAQNWNGLTQFDTSVDGTTARSGGLPSLGEDWEWDTTPRPVKKKKKDADKTRNGSIVKAIKNL